MNITLGSGNQDFALAHSGAHNDTILDFKSRYFSASLNGAQEVPPRASSATATGTGALNFDQTRFAFTVAVSGIDIDGAQTPGTTADNMTGFHIHKAPAGTGGGIVYNPDTDAEFVKNAPAGTLSSGWDSTEGLSGDNLAALLANGTYFNVHTTTFSGGEIRGQILAADTGADRVNLAALNIGSFATVQALMSEAAGSTTIASLFNGLSSSVTLKDIAIAQLFAADFAFAGAVNEVINGSNGADDLFGAGGNDNMRGLGGTDRLFGEDGNDTLNGGLGGDTLNGGIGIDTVTYANATARVTAALDGSLAAAGEAVGDSYTSIERLTGSNFNDALRGNSLANRLAGNNGVDTMDGMAGNDVLLGGLGADILSGGGGSDGFEYTNANQGGDTVTDYTNLAGNNDSLRFLGTAFGGLAKGALDASRFVANTSGAATTVVQRFVYETDTDILRYDADGNGVGAAVVIATFTGLSTLVLGDFVII